MYVSCVAQKCHAETKIKYSIMKFQSHPKKFSMRLCGYWNHSRSWRRSWRRQAMPSRNTSKDYRHQLLSRDNLKQLTGSNVDFCRLGDLCDTLTGYPFKSAEFRDEGILVVRGMNVKRGVLDFSAANNRYWQSSYELERYLLQRDDIIVAMDGSLVGKSLGIFDGEKQALLGQRLTRIRCNSRTCISSYIFNCLSDGLLTEMTEQKKTSGAVPHISLKDIQSIEVPVPPLSVQQRVVDILDRFDALTSSLTDGLPAEIEARRRQYEYYRDRLLDFPRREVDS